MQAQDDEAPSSPSQPPTEDLYARLTVPSSAQESQIKKAFHKLILENHPDKHRHKHHLEQKKYEEITQKLAEAREWLLNPEKRKLYDASRLWTLTPTSFSYAAPPYTYQEKDKKERKRKKRPQKTSSSSNSSSGSRYSKRFLENGIAGYIKQNIEAACNEEENGKNLFQIALLKARPIRVEEIFNELKIHKAFNNGKPTLIEALKIDKINPFYGLFYETDVFLSAKSIKTKCDKLIELYEIEYEQTENNTLYKLYREEFGKGKDSSHVISRVLRDAIRQAFKNKVPDFVERNQNLPVVLSEHLNFICNQEINHLKMEQQQPPTSSSAHYSTFNSSDIKPEGQGARPSMPSRPKRKVDVLGATDDEADPFADLGSEPLKPDVTLPSESNGYSDDFWNAPADEADPFADLDFEPKTELPVKVKPDVTPSSEPKRDSYDFWDVTADGADPFADLDFEPKTELPVKVKPDVTPFSEPKRDSNDFWDVTADGADPFADLDFEPKTELPVKVEPGVTLSSESKGYSDDVWGVTVDDRADPLLADEPKPEPELPVKVEPGVTPSPGSNGDSVFSSNSTYTSLGGPTFFRPAQTQEKDQKVLDALQKELNSKAHLPEQEFFDFIISKLNLYWNRPQLGCLIFERALLSFNEAHFAHICQSLLNYNQTLTPPQSIYPIVLSPDSFYKLIYKAHMNEPPISAVSARLRMVGKLKALSELYKDHYQENMIDPLLADAVQKAEYSIGRENIGGLTKRGICLFKVLQGSEGSRYPLAYAALVHVKDSFDLEQKKREKATASETDSLGYKYSRNFLRRTIVIAVKKDIKAACHKRKDGKNLFQVALLQSPPMSFEEIFNALKASKKAHKGTPTLKEALKIDEVNPFYSLFYETDPLNKRSVEKKYDKLIELYHIEYEQKNNNSLSESYPDDFKNGLSAVISRALRDAIRQAFKNKVRGLAERNQKLLAIFSKKNEWAVCKKEINHLESGQWRSSTSSSAGYSTYNSPDIKPEVTPEFQELSKDWVPESIKPDEADLNLTSKVTQPLKPEESHFPSFYSTYSSATFFRQPSESSTPGQLNKREEIEPQERLNPDDYKSIQEKPTNGKNPI